MGFHCFLHLHLQHPLPLLFKRECVDAPHAWVATRQSWQKDDVKGKKKNDRKKKAVVRLFAASLSSPLCHRERLIRTCHRSNEYHLNCFVYASEVGCRFNLCACLSSRAGQTDGWTDRRRAAAALIKNLLFVTDCQGPSYSGLEVQNTTAKR